MLISLFRVTSCFDTVCNVVTRWVNFRENHLHKHDILLILVLFTFFFNLTLKSSKAKIVNCKYIFFYQRFVHLGENTSKYYSRIIVVHVQATFFFSKVHPACRNIANGIKPGSNTKKTDKHAED